MPRDIVKVTMNMSDVAFQTYVNNVANAIFIVGTLKAESVFRGFTNPA